MKILLVGFYDYPFGYTARVLENNELKRIELDEKDFRIINERGYYEEECKLAYENRKKELFAPYDMVILCEDGCYELLKGVEDNEKIH